MFFIGIISDESNFENIKYEIHKNIDRIKKEKYDVINIRKENINNLKNIKFSSVVVHNNLNGILTNDRYSDDILKILSNIDYLILNSDEKIKINEINNKMCNIVTYGINHKATITVSSIKEKEILVAIQRSIKNIYGNILEQMEYVASNNNENSLENMLAIQSIINIYKD